MVLPEPVRRMVSKFPPVERFPDLQASHRNLWHEFRLLRFRSAFQQRRPAMETGRVGEIVSPERSALCGAYQQAPRRVPAVAKPRTEPQASQRIDHG